MESKARRWGNVRKRWVGVGKIKGKTVAEALRALGNRHPVSAAGARRIVEDSCLQCGRRMGNGEVRVLPPRYVQERDPFVIRGVVRRRFMCLDCYNGPRPPAYGTRQAEAEITC